MKRLAIILALTTTTASADVRAVDGDTVKVPAITVTLYDQSVRLIGIDTPERGRRAGCPMEAEMAEVATAVVAEFIQDGAYVHHHHSFGLGQFGRVPGLLMLRDVIVNEELVRMGLAVETDGKRHEWCEGAPMWSPMPVNRPK